ncbi:RNA polymerase sigma-54 factor [Rhodobacter sp. SGA-6-6]|uniref:RNA polymerase factor sigma-54 n=1 Tax=Rhodobacter sp. SGA-6-6 TaxID=2710882 RepID=UPI0013EB973B|nr:RNA polymerase sigma-54 factor [Rhodobacter sp. SGA-6-6]NGM46086.1 RNA polymerase sigma-54 factor [Rhodobacter sp. SGA-6-6]
MLTTTPRTGPRLTAGLAQAISLLSLTAGELAVRLAVEAAGNPALRLVPPAEGPWRPLFDPEGVAAPSGSLIAHVLAQIAAMRLPPRPLAIALALAEGLEPTGWLGPAPAAVARACGVAEAEVLAVLARLQRIEPGGLFARTLAECLRLQAAAAGDLTPAVGAVLDHLALLARGDLAAIARATGRPEAELAQAARLIRGLNPKPGLVFEGPMPPPPPPDLLARRTPGGWDAVANPATVSVETVPGRGDAAAAAGIGRAVEQRRRVAAMVGTILLRHQAGWLDGGDPAPLATQALAAAAGLHVATVNRLLRGISIRTPRGTLPLRALAPRPVRPDGPAAETVKRRLAELLRHAGGTRPSDARLAAQLQAEGLAVARRTVAKYRAALGGRI